MSEVETRLERRRHPAPYRRLAEMNPFPDSLPAFGVTRGTASALQIDALGNLWVHDYPVPGAGEVWWSVFDATGQWLGRVSPPVDLEVFEIGADYMLGGWEDEFGVEYVRLYDIVKPEPGGT